LYFLINIFVNFAGLYLCWGRSQCFATEFKLSASSRPSTEGSAGPEGLPDYPTGNLWFCVWLLINLFLSILAFSLTQDSSGLATRRFQPLTSLWAQTFGIYFLFLILVYFYKNRIPTATHITRLETVSSGGTIVLLK